MLTFPSNCLKTKLFIKLFQERKQFFFVFYNFKLLLPKQQSSMSNRFAVSNSSFGTLSAVTVIFHCLIIFGFPFDEAVITNFYRFIKYKKFFPSFRTFFSFILWITSEYFLISFFFKLLKVLFLHYVFVRFLTY